MKFFNEQEGANNGSPFVELVVYGFIILIELHKKGNYSKSRANSEQENPERAKEVQKSLEDAAKDMVSQLGDDDRGKVEP